MDSSDDLIVPIKVFLFFHDKDLEVVSEIEQHCEPLVKANKVTVWHHRKINPGQVIEHEVIKNLNNADVVLLMITAHLLNSELFYEVERISIKRAKEKKSIIIPVYLKHCLFNGFDFTEFKMIPEDGNPVVKANLDLTERCHDVAVEIHNIVETQKINNHSKEENNNKEKSKNEVMNILYLVNDLQDRNPELVNEEINCIKHRLLIGKCSCKYDLIPKNVRTLEQLQRALLETRPTIVHFSGYATSANKLVFYNETGHKFDVNPESLCKLFSLFNDKLELVILNSCYSSMQAESIKSAVDFVIGIEGKSNCKIALDFIKGFYQAISFGTKFKKAFSIGKNLLELKNHEKSKNILLLEK